VKTKEEFLGSINDGEFLTIWATVSFYRRIVFHGVRGTHTQTSKFSQALENMILSEETLRPEPYRDSLFHSFKFSCASRLSTVKITKDLIANKRKTKSKLNRHKCQKQNLLKPERIVSLQFEWNKTIQVPRILPSYFTHSFRFYVNTSPLNQNEYTRTACINIS
jgi:hypothetical protein